MNKFPQIHQLAELKQEIGNIYSIFFDKEIKSIIFKLSEKEDFCLFYITSTHESTSLLAGTC